MFKLFNDIPADARVWVYQADRSLNDEEISLILTTGRSFIENWQAHGQDLHSSIEVLHRHFLILAVDQQLHAPSGCSIDESVAFVKNLEQQLRISFFNRKKIGLWRENSVLLIELDELKSRIREGKIKGDDLVINTLVQNKAQLEHWVIPLKNSWLRRYLKQRAHN